MTYSELYHVLNSNDELCVCRKVRCLEHGDFEHEIVQQKLKRDLLDSEFINRYNNSSEPFLHCTESGCRLEARIANEGEKSQSY